MVAKVSRLEAKWPDMTDREWFKALRSARSKYLSGPWAGGQRK
jgi:hypothetical protein